MEKNCKNCKYFCNNRCLHKDMVQENEIHDGIEFIEDGILNEILIEEVNTKNIIMLVLESLSNNDMLKKKYCYNEKTEYKKALKEMSTDIEDIHTDVVNEFDRAISSTIMNKFSGLSRSNFIPNDPDNFYCCNWI